MGRQSLFMALGNVAFVFMGGVLAGYNWRWPFMIYAVAFLILPGVIFLISEPKVKDKVEKEIQQLRFEKFKMVKTVFICFIGFLNMVIYFMVPVYLPFFLENFSNNSSARVGALLSVVGFSWGIFSSQYYKLRKIFSFLSIMKIAFTIIGLAFILLSTADSYSQVIASLILVGIGLGAIVPNLNAWLLSFVPLATKGRALGALLFFIFLGQFFSPVITQPLVAELGISTGYLIAGCFLLVFVSIIFLLNITFHLKAGGIKTKQSI
jgi:MFS family permease